MGVLRLLLAGSDAGHQGKVFRFKSFPQLVSEPLHLPIYFGSSGSRMLQLAGEVADGVILNSITTPAHIHHARNMLKRGAEIAGREPAKTTIAASVIYAVAENIAEAVQAAKEDILFYLGYPEIDSLLEQSGFMGEAETIGRVNRENGKAEALALISERMLESLAIYGEAQTLSGEA
jgi:5,10-methylenetetrahydromethanopterin reductase